jgi:riboflavin synthase
MFTGIVEEVGAVSRAVPAASGRRLRIKAGLVLEGLKTGDSVSVNGVCLTVTAVLADGFDADAIEETLKKTTIASWTPGFRVNLERALKADGRLGGHFVQGHADGTAVAVAVRRTGDARFCDIETSPELSRTIVPKGSVALDGVSLTVAEKSGDRFGIALVPHTLSRTTLGGLKKGDRLNLETDVLGKYVQQFMRSSGAGKKGIEIRRLEELGY